MERRSEAIRAIKRIYQYVFEPLCEPKLGSLSEGDSKINEVCYMLWDTTPLIQCRNSPDKQALHAALAEVMEFATQSDNIACIESGLHGLGHMTFDYPRCSEIVESFITSGRCRDERVLVYAHKARTGHIL